MEQKINLVTIAGFVEARQALLQLQEKLTDDWFTEGNIVELLILHKVGESKPREVCVELCSQGEIFAFQQGLFYGRHAGIFSNPVRPIERADITH